jgi:hypothetical protein
MILVRGLAALAAVAVVVGVAFGCGGLSQSDADIRCNQEKAAKGSCFANDPNAFTRCESCYERCGNDCQPASTCPAQYLCPGDTLLDAGSDAL